MLGLYRIVQTSMEPTLMENDVVFAFKRWRNNYRKGDIVVFNAPDGNRLVKRVAHLSTDGNQLFLLGDNSRSSKDSRHFGCVDKSQVLGKVRLLVFGLNPNPKIAEALASRDFKRLQQADISIREGSILRRIE